MTPLLVRGVAMIVLAGVPAAAAAQVPQTPAEPSRAPLAQLGPVAVRPAVIVREVGYDSNVLNSAGEADGDFTATMGGRLELGIKAARVQSSYSTYYEYVYFRSFEHERGSNRGAEGRADLLLGRMQPYITGSIVRSQERPSAEIDARALRVVAAAGAGIVATAYSRTKLFVGYRRSVSDYDDDERFRGVRLADELNGTTTAVSLGADFQLTPLTSIAVHGEQARDRFEVSPDRDATSYRYGATATFQPLALISGRASLGVRAFRPASDRMADFTGLTAAVALGYAFRDRMHIGVNVDRDLRYSFVDETPYYVSTAGRATFTHRLFGKVDGQALAGLERLAYESRRGAAVAAAHRDRVRTVGAGLGYRLGDGGRVGINVEHVTRASALSDRDYSRTRVYANLTYGL